jgi:DNA-binding protein Fis
VEEIKRRKYTVYTVVLDALELLIVERIFELTKMNQLQTGRSAGIEKMWC